MWHQVLENMVREHWWDFTQLSWRQIMKKNNKTWNEVWLHPFENTQGIMYWNHIQDNMGRRRQTGVKVLLTHNTWLVQSQGAKNRIHKIQIYANKFVVCQVSGSHTKFYANIRLFSFVYLDPAFFIWWIFCLSQSWPGCLRCLIVLYVSAILINFTLSTFFMPLF